MTFKRFIKIALITLAALVVAAGTFLFFWYRSGGLQQTVISQVGERLFSLEEVNKPVTNEKGEVIKSENIGVNFVQKFFGFERPQTFLVLFLNNTELRPGGGFIGTYAVITLDRANPDIVKVEGTEILDNLAPKNFVSEPPSPIREYLGLERWYFRDSNWSPDFADAAAKSLDLYRKQKGVKATEIDAVIGFTPTLIEELLEITGPIKASGMEFTSQNFTEKLEYEVEYGFENKGISFDERKKLLAELTHSVVMSAAKNIFFHWDEYKSLIERMLQEKQVMMYSPLVEYQDVFEAKNWAGKMSGVNYDYLFWVDANLGALKTDAAISRSLRYEIFPTSSGKFLARATMTFAHKGKFDWRTTRYRDYARVFVPVGSTLIRTSGSMKTDRTSEPRNTDQGIENGRQWFGTFISIEPGQTQSLVFEYYVSPEVANRLKANDYRLLVQKQLGTNNTRLTLSLNFDKKLAFASPGEKTENHGDTRYDFATTLINDLEFEIRTK